MMKISYSAKILFFTIISILAFTLMAVSILKHDEVYSYYFCVLSCTVHGIAHSFGESVLLGFFKFFPSDAVNNFAIGTGFSQLFAYLFILLFLNVNIIYGKVRHLNDNDLHRLFAFSCFWLYHFILVLDGSTTKRGSI